MYLERILFYSGKKYNGKQAINAFVLDTESNVLCGYFVSMKGKKT